MAKAVQRNPVYLSPCFPHGSILDNYSIISKGAIHRPYSDFTSFIYTPLCMLVPVCSSMQYFSLLKFYFIF